MSMQIHLQKKGFQHIQPLMNKRALANCGSAKFTAVQLQSSKAKSIDTMNSAHWKPFAILLMLIEMCDVCVPAKCGTYTYLTWLNWRDSRTRRACKQSRDAFFSLTKFSYYFAFYNDAIDRTRDKFQNWNLVYFSCLSKKVFSLSIISIVYAQSFLMTYIYGREKSHYNQYNNEKSKKITLEILVSAKNK